MDELVEGDKPEQQINKALLTKDWPKLSDLLAEYATKPDYDKTLYRYALGALRREQSRYGEAVTLYRQIVAETPDLVYPRFDLGVMLFEEKQYREAEQHLQKVQSDLPPAMSELDWLDDSCYVFNANVILDYNRRLNEQWRMSQYVQSSKKRYQDENIAERYNSRVTAAGTTLSYCISPTALIFGGVSSINDDTKRTRTGFLAVWREFRRYQTIQKRHWVAGECRLYKA